MYTSSVPTTAARICAALLQTPWALRMQHVSQLGPPIYSAVAGGPPARHTRLEHCCGTARVAERLMRRLAARAPHLVSEHDVELVTLGAATHDYGHNPWSHMYDIFILPMAKRELAAREHTFTTHVVDATTLTRATPPHAPLVLSPAPRRSATPPPPRAESPPPPPPPPSLPPCTPTPRGSAEYVRDAAVSSPREGTHEARSAEILARIVASGVLEREAGVVVTSDEVAALSHALAHDADDVREVTAANAAVARGDARVLPFFMRQVLNANGVPLRVPWYTPRRAGAACTTDVDGDAVADIVELPPTVDADRADYIVRDAEALRMPRELCTALRAAADAWVETAELVGTCRADARIVWRHTPSSSSSPPSPLPHSAHGSSPPVLNATATLLRARAYMRATFYGHGMYWTLAESVARSILTFASSATLRALIAAAHDVDALLQLDDSALPWPQHVPSPCRDVYAATPAPPSPNAEDDVDVDDGVSHVLRCLHVSDVHGADAVGPPPSTRGAR